MLLTYCVLINFQIACFASVECEMHFPFCSFSISIIVSRGGLRGGREAKKRMNTWMSGVIKKTEVLEQAVPSSPIIHQTWS